MNDRKELAREMQRALNPASSRFKSERRTQAHKATRFIEIHRERHRGVPFTEEELTRMRGGMTAEQYRWHLICTYLKE